MNTDSAERCKTKEKEAGETKKDEKSEGQDIEGGENRERLPVHSHFVPQLSPRQYYDCTVCSFGVWHGVGRL